MSSADVLSSATSARTHPPPAPSSNLDDLADDAARKFVFFVNSSSERHKSNKSDKSRVSTQSGNTSQPRLSINLTPWRRPSTFVPKPEGVGTTTCAVSYAVELAADNKVLLAGLRREQEDGIGRALGVQIEARPAQVPRVPNLTAMSLDPRDSLKRHMHVWNEASQADGMPSEIVREIGVFTEYLETVPGADSAAALVTIIVHYQFWKYERVVVDMDDKWGAWRIAQFPIIFDLALDKLKYKIDEKLEANDEQQPLTHTKLAKRMRQYQKKVHSLKRMLKDDVKTSVVLVCLPKSRAVAILNHALAEYQKHQIRVAHVIVNKVMNEVPAKDDALPRSWYALRLSTTEITSDDYQSRRKQKALRDIRAKVARVVVCAVPQVEEAVCGVAGLKDFSRFLLSRRKASLRSLGLAGSLPYAPASSTTGAGEFEIEVARREGLPGETPSSAATELPPRQPLLASPGLRGGKASAVRRARCDKSAPTPRTAAHTIPSVMEPCDGMTHCHSEVTSHSTRDGMTHDPAHPAPRQRVVRGARQRTSVSLSNEDALHAHRGVRFANESAPSSSRHTRSDDSLHTSRLTRATYLSDASMSCTSSRSTSRWETNSTHMALAYSHTRQHYSLHRIAKHYSKAREYGNFDATYGRAQDPSDAARVQLTGWKKSLLRVLTHAIHHFAFVFVSAVIIMVLHVPAAFIFMPLSVLDRNTDPSALIITRIVCSEFLLPLFAFPFFSFADIDVMQANNWLLYFTMLTFLGAGGKLVVEYILLANESVIVLLCIRPLYVLFLPVIQAVQLEKGDARWWHICRCRGHAFDKTTYSHIAGFVVLLSAMFSLFFFLLMDELYLSNGRIPFSTIYFFWIQIFVRPMVLFLVKRTYFLVSCYAFGLAQNPSVRYWCALWLNPLLLGLVDAKVAASCRDWPSFAAILVASVCIWFVSVFSVQWRSDKYVVLKAIRTYLNSGETSVFPGWILQEWRGAARIMEHVGLTVALVVVLLSYPILKGLNDTDDHRIQVMLDWWYPNGAVSQLFVVLLLLLEFLEDLGMRYVIKKITGRNFLAIGCGWLLHPKNRKTLIAMTISAGYAIVQLDYVGYIVHIVKIYANQDDEL